jgi:hypothetical protein
LAVSRDKTGVPAGEPRSLRIPAEQPRQRSEAVQRKKPQGEPGSHVVVIDQDDDNAGVVVIDLD